MVPKQESEVRKPYNFRLPVVMLESLDTIARATNRTTTDLVIDSIQAFLDAHNAQICAACNSYNKQGSNFCSNCGLPLNEDGKEELERVRELMEKNPALLMQAAKIKKGRKGG